MSTVNSIWTFQRVSALIGRVEEYKKSGVLHPEVGNTTIPRTVCKYVLVDKHNTVEDLNFERQTDLPTFIYKIQFRRQE